MLNQERVCEMTRLAILDQREGKECGPMTKYFRKDYIAKELLKSLVAGTAAFGLLAAMAGLYYVENLTESIKAFDIRQMAEGAAACYVACMAAYLAVTYAVYYVRYSRGRVQAKNFYMHLKKVNKLYREEEQVQDRMPRVRRDDH